MSLRPPMKYRAANRDFSTGDAVRHTISGEVAVVVERLGRNRLVVSRDDHTTTVWYAMYARTV